jgi:outer membrane protein assembly factor BamD (BamD/ComL family)
MPCVFISHSSLDRDIVAREIITPLRAHGVDTWYSTDDIQTAYEWERQILNGLMTCDWFLVALTPRAVESEWVRREVHWAVMKRKNKIVPVMLETCEPEELHLGLLPIQYIDFRDGGEQALERLLAVWGLDKGAEVKKLYQAARDAISNEDWASAVENLEAVQRLDPTHSQARTDLDHVRQQEYLASLYEDGRKSLHEQRWRDALETLGRLREASGGYKDVEALIAVARAELEKEEAERLYGEATEAAGRGEWAAAVEQFQAVLDITPSHAEAQAGLGRALQQKELAELHAAGLAHLEAGRWSDALKAFRRVRSIDRNYKSVAELIADADAGLAEEEQSRTSAEGQKRTANVVITGNRGMTEPLLRWLYNSPAGWRTSDKVFAVFMMGIIILFVTMIAFMVSTGTSQNDIPSTPTIGPRPTPIAGPLVTPTTDPQATPADPQANPTADPQATPTADPLRKRNSKRARPTRTPQSAPDSQPIRRPNP